jgi:hypothetical protein
MAQRGWTKCLSLYGPRIRESGRLAYRRKRRNRRLSGGAWVSDRVSVPMCTRRCQIDAGRMRAVASQRRRGRGRGRGRDRVDKVPVPLWARVPMFTRRRRTKKCLSPFACLPGSAEPQLGAGRQGVPLCCPLQPEWTKCLSLYGPPKTARLCKTLRASRASTAMRSRPLMARHWSGQSALYGPPA